MADSQKTPKSENFKDSNLDEDNIKNKLYFSKYRAIKKIGEGSFGKIYKAEYKGQFYALKFESRSEGQNLLEIEAIIMSYLKGPNIPYIKSFGNNKEYNILVMELMGKSLENIINIRKKFSIKTTAMLGYQMIIVLQYIHDRHIIHRDIKPDNFVMGYDDKNAKLYLLDFGLAKKYRSSKTLIQYPYIKKKKLTGTARYASIHALEEMEQSRRDDLESLGYVLMYFLRGSLPWQGLKIKSKGDRYKKILEKKKEIKAEDLCRDFPEEFKYYIEYTKELGYNDNPNYDKLKKNFLLLVREKMCENFDLVYDWTSQNDLKKRERNTNQDLLLDEENDNKNINNISIKEEQNISKNLDRNKTEEDGNNGEEIKLDDNGKEADEEKINNQKSHLQENGNKDDKVESICCLM